MKVSLSINYFVVFVFCFFFLVNLFRCSFWYLSPLLRIFHTASNYLLYVCVRWLAFSHQFPSAIITCNTYIIRLYVFFTDASDRVQRIQIIRALFLFISLFFRFIFRLWQSACEFAPPEMLRVEIYVNTKIGNNVLNIIYKK